MIDKGQFGGGIKMNMFSEEMYIVYVNIFLLYSDVIFYYQILNTLFFHLRIKEVTARGQRIFFLSLIP